jgi:hypothetical protein
MNSAVPSPSSAFIALSAINQPLTFGLLFLFFISIWLGKKSCRPGLSITNRLSPSLVIMPIWTIVVAFTFVALFTVPDTKYPESEAVCKDFKDGTLTKEGQMLVKDACETRRLHIAYAGGLMAMAPFFLIAHLIMTFFRVGKGVTIAKWPALMICEISKFVTALLFLVGAQSFVGTGEAAQGSIFFVSISIVFAALMAITLGRIVALVKVARTTEGLTSTNFNSTYFGTDSKCPFATWACCCEKKQETENNKGVDEMESNPVQN